jgi:hypothetical protein
MTKEDVLIWLVAGSLGAVIGLLIGWARSRWAR